MIPTNRTRSKTLLTIGLFVFIVGLILLISKPNPKKQYSAHALKRTAYIFMGIGGIVLFTALITCVFESLFASKNQPWNSNNSRGTQIDPSIHVINIEQPPTGNVSRPAYRVRDPPPSYEDAMRQKKSPSAPMQPIAIPLTHNSARSTRLLAPRQETSCVK